MLRFERKTNDLAEITGALGLACTFVVVLVLYVVAKLDGIVPLMICGTIVIAVLLAFLNSLRKILWPTTQFIEVSESSISYGSIEKATDACRHLFDDAQLVFVDFDERHIRFTDLQGHQSIIGQDLVLTGSQMQQIADILWRVLPPDRVAMNQNMGQDLTESAQQIDGPKSSFRRGTINLK